MPEGKVGSKRRVGWRLLILLWIWVVCVFAVVDLFLNVPEFDRIRPDAEIYRSTRYVAHKLVGVPYEESDEFGRGNASSDPEALAEVRQRVAALGRNGRHEVYLDVPESLLRRVDLRNVEPPPQHRGTRLEWWLHGRMGDDKIARLLVSLEELEQRDRRAVLRRVHRDPDPRVASALIEARKSVDGPTNLLLYAAAAGSVARVLSATDDVGGENIGNKSAAADVVQALLDSLVRVVTRFRQHLNESQWRGVFKALAQLYEKRPGFDRMPRYRPLVTEIRAATMTTLVDAAKPVPNYMGGLETVRLGILVADEATWDVLLDLLRARAIFNQKIASTSSRTDLAFLEMTAGAIRRSGNDRQREALANVIAQGLQDSSDSATRKTLVRLGRSLLESVGEKADVRTVAALESALRSAEGKR